MLVSGGATGRPRLIGVSGAIRVETSGHAPRRAREDENKRPEGPRGPLSWGKSREVQDASRASPVTADRPGNVSYVLPMSPLRCHPVTPAGPARPSGYVMRRISSNPPRPNSAFSGRAHSHSVAEHPGGPCASPLARFLTRLTAESPDPPAPVATQEPTQARPTTVKSPTLSAPPTWQTNKTHYGAMNTARISARRPPPASPCGLVQP